MSVIKSFAKKIGMDKSIAYSSGARIIQGFSGIVSVFFITSFLTGVEQGFYYTFGSILALQVFFELGLTGIMTQYVAHEASHLELDINKYYQGEVKYKSKLASLIHFCVKWYSVLACLVFVFLLIVGNIYFQRFGDSQSLEVEWNTPWMLICVGTGIKLFEAPITSILTGLGFVKEMSKIGFWQQIIIPVATWIGLACGLKLYVLGIGYILSVLIWFTFIYSDRLLPIIINLWRQQITDRVGYFEEIFPYQWRIALSWVSGYFIFNLFNPVLFATEGAIVAGQMGMTLSILNAIQSFSLSWINTKIPLYSKLIALKEYVQLDELFNRTLKQMVSICAFLLLSFFCVVWFLRFTELQINGNLLGYRFLDYAPMILMMIPVFLQQFTASWATYLRCHKKEPFLLNSIVGGVLCMSSTLGLGDLFGIYGVTIGYCIITILMFPWGYWLYYSNKMKWHGNK